MKVIDLDKNPLSRRAALKVLVAAGGAASLATLPEQWQPPLIEVGMLPAHAQISAEPPGAFFRLIEVRQLTACENHGKHHIFVKVQDAGGQGINGLPVKICWGTSRDDCVMARTATLPNWSSGYSEPGWVNFAMFKGTYAVEVYEGNSQVASGLTPDDGVQEACDDDFNANGPGHISFQVIFERNY